MNNKKTRALFAYSSIGIQLALFVFVFVFGGYKLDKYLNSSPWFLLLGAFLGIGSGLYSLFKSIKQLDDMDGKEKEDNKGKWI